jgi:hypothetical protein
MLVPARKNAGTSTQSLLVQRLQIRTLSRLPKYARSRIRIIYVSRIYVSHNLHALGGVVSNLLIICRRLYCCHVLSSFAPLLLLAVFTPIVRRWLVALVTWTTQGGSCDGRLKE